MTTSPTERSTRQSWFAALNATFVVLFILMALYSRDGLAIYALIGLLILGPVQFIAALVAAIKGDRIQGYYVLASVIFLGIYIGTLNDYFPFISRYFDRDAEMVFMIGAPLMMASIYTAILLFRPTEVAKSTPKVEDELLDDEIFQ